MVWHDVESEFLGEYLRQRRQSPALYPKWYIRRSNTSNSSLGTKEMEGALLDIVWNKSLVAKTGVKERIAITQTPLGGKVEWLTRFILPPKTAPGVCVCGEGKTKFLKQWFPSTWASDHRQWAIHERWETKKLSLIVSQTDCLKGVSGSGVERGNPGRA